MEGPRQGQWCLAWTWEVAWRLMHPHLPGAPLALVLLDQRLSVAPKALLLLHGHLCPFLSAPHPQQASETAV